MLERLERLTTWSDFPGLPIVYVDYREEQSGLLRLLTDSNLAEIRKTSLPSGDIAVGNTGIERKTYSDFVRSLEDHRLFRQLILLKRSYHQRLLIVEGRGSDPTSWRTLRGVILKITCGLQIPILHSTNLEDTAAYIHQIAYQQLGLTHRPIYIPPRLSKPEAIEFQQVFFLSGIPGIGVARARALLKHFGSLARVLSATESQLREVAGIGPKFANEIVSLLHAPAGSSR